MSLETAPSPTGEVNICNNPDPNFTLNCIVMEEGNLLDLPSSYAIAHCVKVDFKLSDGLAKNLVDKFGLC